MVETEEKKKKLTAEQKWGLVILTFFGIAVFGFGLWQFLYRVKSPFFGKGTGLKNFKDLDQQKIERMLAKQKKDTDGDGLTDFDEEYIYRTSPYLEDSDSDGFLDKQEIDSGNDPNCPAGKNCGLPEVMAVGETGGVGAAGGAGTVTGMETANLAEMQALLGGRATPEIVRAALREAGVNKEMLSKIDDKTLMELYQESLKETGVSQSLQNLNLNTNTVSNTNSNTNFNVNFSNLFASTPTPSEVRELFRQAGIDEATLSKIDDQTLMQIFEEAMKE